MLGLLFGEVAAFSLKFWPFFLVGVVVFFMAMPRQRV